MTMRFSVHLLLRVLASLLLGALVVFSASSSAAIVAPEDVVSPVGFDSGGDGWSPRRVDWTGSNATTADGPSLKTDVLDFYGPRATGESDDIRITDRVEDRDAERRGEDHRYRGGTAVSVVPLPASLPLLLWGLGVLGWAAYRRT